MSNSSPHSKPIHGTKSLRRMLDLLAKVAANPDGLSLAELSKGTGIPKSTAHRILSLMIEHKLVRTNPQTKQYLIGRLVLEYSHAYLKSFNFLEEARPHLLELKNQFDETVHLGVLDESGQRVIYIDKLDSSRAVRMFSRIGQTVPIHCTSLGKSLVACVPTTALAKSLKDYEFTTYTPNTITNKEDFIKELAQVRTQRYALDNFEHEETVMCVGTSICNNNGEIIAAISISFPKQRIPANGIDNLIQAVIRTGNNISNHVRNLPSVEIWG